MTSMYEKPLILVRTGLKNIGSNCTIGFICRWVLFMFLLGLYFRLLDNIDKPQACFKTVFYFFVISVAFVFDGFSGTVLP